MRSCSQVGGARLARLYRESDLFLLTSLFENYCMAAQEATFFGVPVLAYDVGELEAWLQEDHHRCGRPA